MNLIRSTLAVVVAGVVVTGGAAGASADTAVGSDACAVNHVCLYKYPNLVGKVADRASGGPVLDLPQAATNARSWINRGYSRASLYDGRNGAGRCTTLLASSLDTNVEVFDHVVLSWRTDRGC
ncbi:MAG: peptidase inhibitor family I36 protein [Umezawaea sp.]